MHVFLFFTHIPFVVNHTINATPPKRLQQHPLLFTTNHTDPTFFVWRLNSARPPHPGHSTILLRSEIPSGLCAKLRTVAASNNRDHPTRSLHYCLFVPHTCIFVLRAHPVRGESHNQCNTTGEVATAVSILLHEAEAPLELFAFNQLYLAKGKIAPVVFLPHEAKQKYMIFNWRIRTGLYWWFSKILLIRIRSDPILSGLDSD